jgi:hypothetical protein
LFAPPKTDKKKKRKNCSTTVFENDVHHVVKQDKKARMRNVRTAIYWDNISQSTTRHYRCGSYLEKNSFLKTAITASYFS